MPVSDREIYRLAHFFIRLDGEQARPRERRQVAARHRGDRRNWGAADNARH